MLTWTVTRLVDMDVDVEFGPYSNLNPFSKLNPF
jgi:hypothetical protein